MNICGRTVAYQLLRTMMRETTSRHTKVSYTIRHLFFGKNAGNSVILIDVVKHRLLMEATLTGKVASICKAAGLRRINGGKIFHP